MKIGGLNFYMTKPQVGNLILKKITFHVLTIYMIMCLASCIFLLVEIKNKVAYLKKEEKKKASLFAKKWDNKE